MRPQTRPLAPRFRTLAAGVCAVGLLASCSGGGDSSADDSTPTPTPTTPTVSVEPGTTPPGTTVKMGKAATVRYKPNPEHNSLIKLRVTKVQRGKIKQLKEFRLSAKTKRSSVYYVKATVTNTGSGDLSGQVVSLYGKVSKDLVVPPVNFRGGFKRCQHQPLPKKFTKGKSADLCVVMLAPKHGKVTAVQWRPANDAEPISWPAR